MSKGRPSLAGLNTTLGAFTYLLMFPTLLTMFVSGLWHGAGYGFIIWGLLHGSYLTINHAWRLLIPRFWSDRQSYDRVMRPVGGILTFVVVCASIVFFRAPTVTSEIDLAKGLIGLNGIGLPEGLFDHLGPLAGTLHKLGVIAEPWSIGDFAKSAIWIFVLMVIALACPNTLEIMAPYEPALGVKPHPNKLGIRRLAEWSISLPWAIAVSAVAAIGIASLGGPSEFLYWQF